MRCKSAVDRTGCCLRCGVNGHKVATCLSDLRCFICYSNNSKKTNHYAGSRMTCSQDEGYVAQPQPLRCGSRPAEPNHNVVVLVVAKYLSVVETTCNQTIARIQQWLDLVVLELAPHKTEAVLVSCRKKVESANISVAGTLVSSKRASLLSGALGLHGHEGGDQQRAFRTVSDEAAHVIAGIAPLEFLAEERSAYYQETHGRGMDVAAKRHVRMACKQESLRRWQQRWDTPTKGRWTHQLILSSDAFAAQRQRLEVALGGTITKQNLVPYMLLSPDNWEATSNFAAIIKRELRAVVRQTRDQLD
ncbi:GL19681 [Drosophila persimilis]|uniref:GL19681 n=1 Tax=Drosophila persimilis TaxID=7234 RepID=B4HCV5_DROPE|nr:GL19681 [Drosophila persimilis]